MEGTRDRYKRAIRWRAPGELEESRAGFWTNIDVIINEGKSCE